MKKVLMIVCAAVLAGSTFVARADHPDMPSPNGNGEDRGDNPLARGDRSDEAAFYKFSSMVAVDGAFVGTTNPIRGLAGDAIPRALFDAHGSLSAGGRLHIEVQGLVAANETSVPAASQGVNEQASFRGLVSCLSEATDGTVTTVNVMTDPFPATPGGRANIQGSVALPAQCIAPVVFVTSAAGDTWLAVVGIESTSSTTTP
jgi:hypothetical protein